MQILGRIYLYRSLLRFYTFSLLKKTDFSNQISIKIIIVLSMFLTSCGKSNVSLKPGQGGDHPVSVSVLDPQERSEVVVNPLFAAVADNKPQQEIEKILSKTPNSIYSVNKRGDTNLGLAIQLKNINLSLFLLKKITCEDLKHQNNKGESYVYLSAKQGYVELIEELAKKCFENSFLWPDYEFSELDPKTEEGETAIHVALNGAVASALAAEYDRGSLEFSWFPFLHAENHRGETFLHTAVKDNRLNTLQWAVDTYCHPGDWERSKNPLKKWPSVAWQQFWNGIQGWTALKVDQVFNMRDNKGGSPLHLACQKLNIEAIRILANCRWQDTLLTHKKNNNIAVQDLLLALDPHITNHTQGIKDIFVLLVHQQNYLPDHLTRTVDHQNNKDNSSLHIAGTKADPFFYNYLKQYGDIYLKNQEGQTPEDIFNTTQNKVY